MIGFIVARHSFLWIRTNPFNFSRWGKSSRGRTVPPNHLKTQRKQVDTHDINISEAELPTPKSLEERFIRVRVLGGDRVIGFVGHIVGVP